MKRGTSKSPDEWELEIKMPELNSLKKKGEEGEIDLRYFDESGFTLTPYVPYGWKCLGSLNNKVIGFDLDLSLNEGCLDPPGWQEKSKPIIIKSSKSKRINVLGLMNKNLELDYEIIVGKVNSETII